jgi:hypothetical protein
VAGVNAEDVLAGIPVIVEDAGTLFIIRSFRTDRIFRSARTALAQGQSNPVKLWLIVGHHRMPRPPFRQWLRLGLN